MCVCVCVCVYVCVCIYIQTSTLLPGYVPENGHWCHFFLMKGQRVIINVNRDIVDIYVDDMLIVIYLMVVYLY